MRGTPFLPEAGAKRLRRLLAALRRAAGNPGEEAVHDLRVAIRRMLAFLDLAAPLSGGERPHPPEPKRTLLRLMRPLGRLRDAHVKLLRLKALAPTADPGTRLYALAVRSDAEKWERLAARALTRAKPARIRKAFRALPLSPRPAADLETPALAILRAREAEVARIAEEHLGDPSPDSLHELRLAFKAYRYTAEALSPLLPGLTPEAGDRLHAFQTLLGDLHDFDVLLAEAARFRLRVLGSPGPALDIETAVESVRRDSDHALLEMLRGGEGVSGLFRLRDFA